MIGTGYGTLPGTHSGTGKTIAAHGSVRSARPFASARTRDARSRSPIACATSSRKARVTRTERTGRTERRRSAGCAPVRPSVRPFRARHSLYLCLTKEKEGRRCARDSAEHLARCLNSTGPRRAKNKAFDMADESVVAATHRKAALPHHGGRGATAESKKPAPWPRVNQHHDGSDPRSTGHLLDTLTKANGSEQDANS